MTQLKNSRKNKRRPNSPIVSFATKKPIANDMPVPIPTGSKNLPLIPKNCTLLSSDLYTLVFILYAIRALTISRQRNPIANDVNH